MKTSRFLLPLALALLPGVGAAQVINVEIDYMVDTDHSHMPQPAEIQALVDMFACHGYTLNVIVDDPIPHTNVMRCNDPGDDDFFNCFSGTYTTFAELKVLYGDNTGPGWHYCIFGHRYDNGDGTGSSGLAELGGNDLIVTLGGFTGEVGTPFDRAATLAHELGHNLGLRHTTPGSSLATSDPFSPVYASVMSYQYQLTGVASQMSCLGLVDQDHRLKDLDYSNGRMPAVDEAALEEATGLGIHAVDWDCDGVVDAGTVAVDIDGGRPWCGGVGFTSVLADYNDWANLQDNARLPRVFEDKVRFETEKCITFAEVQALREASAKQSGAGLADPTACAGSSPTLTTEGCPPGLMIWVDPSASPLINVGTGTFPYKTIGSALAAAPDHSVLYLQPGLYTGTRGTSIVLSDPVVLAGPGGAVIDP